MISLKCCGVTAWSKMQRSIYSMLLSVYEKKRDKRKYTYICLFVQKKHSKDKLETKETGYL